MILKIKCPSCGRQFSIEPTAAVREIDRLKKDNAYLRASLAAMEAMKRNDSNPLKGFFGGMGL